MLNDIDIDDIVDSIYTMRDQLKNRNIRVKDMAPNDQLTAVDMHAHMQAVKIDRIAEKLDGINNTLERLANTIETLVKSR